MKSYLLSGLALRFRSATLESFLRAHPNDWLVWEAGAWSPNARATTVVVPSAPGGGPRVGEGLAVALVRSDRPLTVGRTEDNDVVLNDGTVSQRHLVLMYGSGGWLARDVGSSNGSWIEERKLSPGMPQALKSGGRLRLGNAHMSFLDPAGMFGRIGPTG